MPGNACETWANQFTLPVITSSKKLLALLSVRERRQAGFLLVLMAIMAILETLGIAAIMPFLAVLGNPELISSNQHLAYVYGALGFRSDTSFLFFLGLSALAVVIAAALFRTLSHYALSRFTQMRRHTIGRRLLELYLRQPYPFFLGRNSAELSKTVLSEVDQVIANVLLPTAVVIAYSLVAFLIVIVLVLVEPLLALAAGLILLILYAAIFFATRRLLQTAGAGRVEANKQRFVAANETLGGIKEIKLLGAEAAYLGTFQDASMRFSKHQVTNLVIAESPRFVVEAIGVSGILLLALYLLATRGSLGEILPLLGLYTLAGYRLLPAMQRIYGALTNLRFGRAAIDRIYDDMVSLEKTAEATDSVATVPLGNQLRLVDVGFSYDQSGRRAISSVDITIPFRSTVAFVGPTGSGKTTVVDILLGLLTPTDGYLSVDDTVISADNVRGWKHNLGYVPQHIFLSDTSIAENIAFGSQGKKIDMEAVIRAAKLAQIDGFVQNELPDGYATVVGERGVRLSGGQRQRIGIARALYRDPPVLVMDEATSALDAQTERAVIDAVRGELGGKTIIMITHRLSTIRMADRIFVLEGGRLVSSGSYSELSQSCKTFRDLADGQAVARVS